MAPKVPEAWKPRLRQYLRERQEEERDSLSAVDFPSGQSVSILFPDGSYAFFRHAFAIRDQDQAEFIVFTEHCGYHVFPLADTVVEELQLSNPHAADA